MFKSLFSRLSSFATLFLRSIFLISTILVNPKSAAASPFKLGVILPLSGSLSEYGVAFKNGLELAAERESFRLSSKTLNTIIN